MAELSRCDDCLAQIEPMDWYGHRMWHKDQEELVSDLRADVGKLEEQSNDSQDVFSDLIPRLEKIEGLAAIFDAFAEKQLDKT
jgi:hypothetical protein